jgi:hypothetical protein
MDMHEVDHDGDPVALTEDDQAHMLEEITDIETELEGCNDQCIRRELERRRRHLLAELEADQRLPLPDDEE